MKHMTITELQAEAEAVCKWLIAERDYDSADFHWFIANEHSISFELSFKDDFQDGTDRAQRYHSGAYQTIQIEYDSSLWTWAASLPTRRQRETAFLIRQLRPIAAAAEQVKDLEIQEIIQGILGANVSLHNLLEHKTEEQKDNEDFPF